MLVLTVAIATHHLKIGGKKFGLIFATTYSYMIISIRNVAFIMYVATVYDTSYVQYVVLKL